LVKGQVIGISKLARLAAFVPPIPDELAVAGKHLNPVITGVGHVQVAVRAERQRPGAGELARFVARAAPALEELAARVELGDALVLAEFGDVQIAVLVLDYVADVAELPRLRAG